jgi:hypothetical protein
LIVSWNLKKKPGTWQADLQATVERGIKEQEQTSEALQAKLESLDAALRSAMASAPGDQGRIEDVLADHAKEMGTVLGANHQDIKAMLENMQQSLLPSIIEEVHPIPRVFIL